MAIECVHCFTHYCRATYKESALELRRWSESIGTGVSLWKQGHTDWLEREAGVSLRYIPPPTGYGARAARCVDLVAYSGYSQILDWLLDSLSRLDYFEDCIGWLKWVSSIAKANARSCPEMGMLVDVHRWFGHFPLEGREEAFRSTQAWLGHLNAPASCPRPDMWERICYVEAVAHLEATFSSTRIDEALVPSDFFPCAHGLPRERRIDTSMLLPLRLLEIVFRRLRPRWLYGHLISICLKLSPDHQGKVCTRLRNTMRLVNLAILCARTTARIYARYGLGNV
ncbi:hypothetical protein ACOME3_010426 [Neoechinorhynchus agilis]